MNAHTNTFLLVTILVLVTILLIAAMRFFAALRKARLQVGSEQAYRDLAETSAKTQAETAAALREMQTGLSQIDSRLGSVEKLLNEVG